MVAESNSAPSSGGASEERRKRFFSGFVWQTLVFLGTFFVVRFLLHTWTMGWDDARPVDLPAQFPPIQVPTIAPFDTPTPEPTPWPTPMATPGAGTDYTNRQSRSERRIV